MDKKLTFNFDDTTDPSNDSEPPSEPTLKRGILKKDTPYKLENVDTNHINMYELTILHSVPWLENYSNTFIKVYSDEHTIYYNKNTFINKDREYFYEAKPQFYELLSNINSDVVFDRNKNILTVSNVDIDGSSIIYTFTICYYLTGRNVDGTFLKEDTYLLQSQVCNKEIVWRKMNNIPTNMYQIMIFGDDESEPMKTDDLETYEVNALLKKGKGYFKRIEDKYPNYDDIVDSLYEDSKDSAVFVGRLVNMVVLLEYRPDVFVFKHNRNKIILNVGDNDLLPMLPMLTDSEKKHLYTTIDSTIKDFKKDFYNSIFPKHFRYKTLLDYNNMDMKQFAKIVSVNKVKEFILRNDIEEYKSSVVNISNYKSIIKYLIETYGVMSTYFEYDNNKYTMLSITEEGVERSLPFHIQTLKNQFLTNHVNHYTNQKFDQSFINKINTINVPSEIHINVTEKESYSDIEYLLHKFESYVIAFINEQETSNIYNHLQGRHASENDNENVEEFPREIPIEEIRPVPREERQVEEIRPVPIEIPRELPREIPIELPREEIRELPREENKETPLYSRKVKSIKYDNNEKKFVTVYYDSYKEFEEDGVWPMIRIKSNSKFHSA